MYVKTIPRCQFSNQQSEHGVTLYYVSIASIIRQRLWNYTLGIRIGTSSLREISRTASSTGVLMKGEFSYYIVLVARLELL